ncbi:hypothetical protein [Saccharopolyspora griseoalba]|uniref:Outer membrane channel protein CpnT-like N-terminal domain-containing protein n=1 Tax=Saccharopolyspora griseoalba TaxID=1431848 RepID=A0ABW2LKP3_9PSEU
MSIEMPDEVKWLLPIVVGQSWPEGDEDAMRRMADAWRAAADGIEQVRDSANGGAAQAGGAMTGKTAEAFDELWKDIGEGGEAALPKLKEACEKLAKSCDDAALDVEHTKLTIIASLIALAIQLAAMAAAAPFTFGASSAGAAAAQVATRSAVQVFFRQLVMSILKNVAIEVASSVAIEFAVQGVQVAQGNRDGLDAGKFGEAAVSGAIGGAVGGVFEGVGKGIGKGAGNAVGDAAGDAAREAGTAAGRAAGDAAGDAAREAAESAAKAVGKEALQEGALGAPEGATPSAAEQLITQGEVDWGDVGMGAASGGVTGAGMGAAGAGLGRLGGDVDVPDTDGSSSSDGGSGSDSGGSSSGDSGPDSSSGSDSAPSSGDSSSGGSGSGSSSADSSSSDAASGSSSADSSPTGSDSGSSDADSSSSAPDSGASSAGSDSSSGSGADGSATPTSSVSSDSGGSSSGSSDAAASSSSGGGSASTPGDVASGSGSSTGSSSGADSPATPSGAPSSGSDGSAASGTGSSNGSADSSTSSGGSAASTASGSDAPGDGPARSAGDASSDTAGAPSGTGTSASQPDSSPGSSTSDGAGSGGAAAASPSGGAPSGGATSMRGSLSADSPDGPATTSSASESGTATAPPAGTAAPSSPSPAAPSNPTGPSGPAGGVMGAPPAGGGGQGAGGGSTPSTGRSGGGSGWTGTAGSPGAAARPTGEAGPSPDSGRPKAAARGPEAPARPAGRTDLPQQRAPHSADAAPHREAPTTRPEGTRPDANRPAPDGDQRPPRPDGDGPADQPRTDPDPRADAEPGTPERQDQVAAAESTRQQTPAGSSFHTDPNMRELADKVPDDGVHHTADVHALPDGRVRIGDHTFSAKEFADVLRDDPDWDGKPIRLLSCDAGTSGLARDLANELGVPVTAPRGLAWTDGSGRVFASDMGPDGRPGWPPNGGWDTHDPDGTTTEASNDGFHPPRDGEDPGQAPDDAEARGQKGEGDWRDRPYEGSGRTPRDKVNDPGYIERHYYEREKGGRVELVWRSHREDVDSNGNPLPDQRDDNGDLKRKRTDEYGEPKLDVKLVDGKPVLADDLPAPEPFFPKGSDAGSYPRDVQQRIEQQIEANMERHRRDGDDRALSHENRPSIASDADRARARYDQAKTDATESGEIQPNASKLEIERALDEDVVADKKYHATIRTKLGEETGEAVADRFSSDFIARTWGEGAETEPVQSNVGSAGGRSGADEFDQIREPVEGEFLVTEAKGPYASYDARWDMTGSRRVQQGHPAYFDTILSKLFISDPDLATRISLARQLDLEDGRVPPRVQYIGVQATIKGDNIGYEATEFDLDPPQMDPLRNQNDDAGER